MKTAVAMDADLVLAPKQTACWNHPADFDVNSFVERFGLSELGRNGLCEFVHRLFTKQSVGLLTEFWVAMVGNRQWKKLREAFRTLPYCTVNESYRTTKACGADKAHSKRAVLKRCFRSTGAARKRTNNSMMVRVGVPVDWDVRLSRAVDAVTSADVASVCAFSDSVVETTFVPLVTREDCERVARERGAVGVEDVERQTEDLWMRMQAVSIASEEGSFRGCWHSQGRYYHPFSAMPKEFRRLLLIDRVRVAEPDVHAMHVAILVSRFATGGERQRLIEMLQGDFYEEFAKHAGVPNLDRKRVKQGFLSSVLFTRRPASGIPCWKAFKRLFPRTAAKLAKVRDTGQSIRTLRKYGICFGRPFSRLVDTFDGQQRVSRLCSRVEGRIMTRAILELASRGVKCLPMHDSLIVPEPQRQLSAEIIAQCCRDVLGFDVRVT